VVGGLRFTVCSAWFTVYGLWFMVYGLQFTGYGSRFTVARMADLAGDAERVSVSCVVI
jgi:hypothetical protein